MGTLLSPVPLLGALLVSEELLTQEQLVACLMQQNEDDSELPLGQICISRGFITQHELDRVLQIQQETRASLMHVLDTHPSSPADLTAHIIASRPWPALLRHLSSLGVSVQYLDLAMLKRHLALQQRPDLVLVEHDALPAGVDLPHDLFIGLLPPARANADQPLAAFEVQLITGYVMQIRELARARMGIELSQRYEFDLRMLSTMIRLIANAATRQTMLVQLMTFVRDTIGVEAGTLYELDQAAQQLIFTIVLGPHQEELGALRLSIDHGLAGWVARNNEPLMILDVSQDSRFEFTFDKKTGFQTKSVLCVPISVRGHVIGVIQLINKAVDQFTDHDLMLLRTAAAIGALVHSVDRGVPAHAEPIQ